MRPVHGAGNPPVNDGAQDKRLRVAARQLEGVFIAQLQSAMQATVPDDGFLGSSQADEMFRGMFNDHIAQLTASDLDSSGIGQALYEQLRARITRQA